MLDPEEFRRLPLSQKERILDELLSEPPTTPTTNDTAPDSQFDDVLRNAVDTPYFNNLSRSV